MNTQNDVYKKVNDALNWRYATKKFDANKKIKDEDFNALLEAMRLTPSSFGLQPWKLLVIDNPEMREKLKAVAWGQAQVTEASHLIVLTATTHMTEADIQKLVETTAKVQGVPESALEGYKDIMKGALLSQSEAGLKEWMKRQVYIALGFGLETAALMNIDACPMEGFDSAKFDEILGLEAKGLTSVVLLPVGYRSDADDTQNRKKVRYEFSEVVERI